MERSVQPLERRVRSVELFPARVPLSPLARGAMAESDNGLGMAIPTEEPWLEADFLFCRLTDGDGNEGWGESYVWLPESGVSNLDMASAIELHLGKYVLGSDPASAQALAARFDRNVARNEMAKGLIDIACHDLAARQIGRPVHDLLGGTAVDRIPLCGLVPLADPEDVAAIADGYRRAGYGTVRIKLGTGAEADRDRIAAVRERCGHELRIRVDYNQAYDVPAAVRAIGMIEPFGIDGAEQPLPMGDLIGMTQVARRTGVPIFLHEGFFSMGDLVALIDAGGCGVVGINTERPGGITGAVRAIDYAAARGMGTIIHNQPLGLGTAAHVHVAAARADRLGHAVELAGDVMFEEHLVKERCIVAEGHIHVPTGAGLGVEMDRDALDDHLVAAPVLLSA
ncbi:MAG: mandelate racemase/muconate lactonizing enzyme family protein [Actinomycetota bacterium]|nr:mandelate racemase/muconate lactonizing enzyme family protein [Actinomycetota bacterium]